MGNASLDENFPFVSFVSFVSFLPSLLVKLYPFLLFTFIFLLLLHAFLSLCDKIIGVC